MSLEDDLRRIQAQDDATAARWHEQAEWLRNQVHEFNSVVAEAAAALRFRGVQGAPVAERTDRLFGSGVVETITTSRVWVGSAYNGLMIADDGLYRGQTEIMGRGMQKVKGARPEGAKPGDGYVVLKGRVEDEDNSGQAPGATPPKLGGYRVGRQREGGGLALNLAGIGYEGTDSDARQWLTGAVLSLVRSK